MLYLFLLGRILLGGYFLKSAYNHFKNHKALAGYAASKGTPLPTQAVLGTGVLLLLGGLGILFGVMVEWAVLCIVVFLVGVTFKMHQYWNDGDPMMKMSDEINFYKNLALLGAVLMLLSVPLPWPMSLF
jgi:putative oxidoreductase